MVSASSPRSSAVLRSRRLSRCDFRDELDIDGKPHDLSQHRGKVVLVSNVASA